MDVHAGAKVAPTAVRSTRCNKPESVIRTLKTSMPRTISTEVIDIDGIPVYLTWKSGVRTMRVRVTAPDGKVVGTAPARTARREVIRVLTSRADWMRHAIHAMQSRPHPQPLTYTDGEIIYLFGIPYRLHLAPSATLGRKTIYIEGEDIVVSLPPQTTVAQRKRLIQDFFKQRLAIALDVYMRHYTTLLQCPPIPYRILRRRSVWGTFHPATRSIVFNLHLIHVSPAYIQYIVLHELTHQYVAAHNAEFYRRIATFMPDWRERRTALQQFAQQHICMDE